LAKILLIEDDAPIRANLRCFLLLEGYQVLEAEDGASGLELARSQRPDLILCDVLMPQVDGFEVLRQLRQSPATAAIPFVFVSASADLDARRAGLALGAADYVTKPFALPELAALIASRLKRT
jgi:DNA-binding response OmpR family regulator